MARVLIVCALVVFAHGCSDNNADAHSRQNREPVFDSQINTLDAAKGVEQQIGNAAAEREKSMRNQGG
jgi:hypothetical protein